jgi:two-component system, cell cycle sensor histidine kinase and response regulator CckA
MNSRPPRVPGGADLKPARITLFYVAVGVAWIYGSGWVVNLLTSGDTNSFLEFAKGTGFVAATAAALYVVLARRARSISRAEAAREEADRRRARLETAVEQVAEGVVVTDSDALIQYVNPAFESMSGFAMVDLLGRSANTLGGLEGGTDHRLWSRLNSDQTWHGNLVNRRTDGSTYEVEATISPIHDEKGGLAGFVGVERDVSGERALERELEEAGRLEAVGQLAGGIAHDFNNQLMAISGYAEILQGEVADNPTLEADAREILRAAHSAAALVRQLLTLARRATQDPRPLRLDALLTELRPMLDGLLGPRIHLDVLIDTDLATVWADPHQLEQVVVNMVVNARDATGDGGTVALALANAEIGAEDPLATRVEPGPYVVLTVSDTGQGMDRATMARVFEPFFTTKPVGQGTGLGLATAWGIVRQAHGHLAVESEVGRGTTFTIHLPRYDGPAAPEPAVDAVLDQPGGTETIFVVEDEEAVRQVLGRNLGELGYRVIVTGNADEAEAAWVADGATVRLLVTDIRLPGVDGPTLAARLRRGRPDLRVLYVSGYAGDAMLDRGLVGREDAFLGKPFSARELALRVRSLLDGPPEVTPTAG